MDDRNASADLSKQPPEKLFRLLAFELMKEEKRPPEPRFGVLEFQQRADAACPDKLVDIAQRATRVSEEVREYHLNITGTAGLYWLLHAFPEEHSWAWLIAVSHERVMRKVGHHFTRLLAYALDDLGGCLSPSFRTALMNAAATWRRIYGDFTALLWNGVAFGILGDVTSWRELDEEGQAANEPGGPPPNVSWSENIIFGNMWVSSVQKFMEHHAEEVNSAAYNELARAQAGVPPDPNTHRYLHGEQGVLPAFEVLKRQLFGGWPRDAGLLRGFLRHCLRPGYGDSAPPTVGDFGAGGGRYSMWLNDTGLVHAFAFDAAFAVEDITGGAVSFADLAVETQLYRKFDWVLCIDVIGGMAEDQARALLRNAGRHATAGLVISYPKSNTTEAEFVALAEAETGLRFDAATTALLAGGCEQKGLGASIAVFRAPGLATSASASPAPPPAHGAAPKPEPEAAKSSGWWR